MGMAQSAPVIKPAALRGGDAVAVVAPASNLKADYLARGVADAILRQLLPTKKV